MGEHFAADYNDAFHSRGGLDFVEDQRPASCAGRIDNGARFCGADSDGDAFPGAVVVLDFCRNSSIQKATIKETRGRV